MSITCLGFSLVFVALVCGAQSSEDLTLEGAAVTSFSGTSDRATRILFNANNPATGGQVNALVFVESREGFTVENDVQVCNRAPFCKYPAHVYPTDTNMAPYVGYFLDECTLLNEATASQTYQSGYAFKIYYDEGRQTITFNIGMFSTIDLGHFGVNNYDSSYNFATPPE